jgi:glycerol-3-phosphate O-acyltransferase/dihydroxyacetone phosphate acyltransferase
VPSNIRSLFALSSYKSSKSVRSALSTPNYKVKARDVMATAKALAAFGLAPVMYAFYSCSITAWLQCQGVITNALGAVPVVLLVLVFLTQLGLWFGEDMVDTIRVFVSLLLLSWPRSAGVLRQRNSRYNLLVCAVEEFAESIGLKCTK